MRVLCAMSGGVDSSVAAARLVAAGHDVVGVHLALAPNPQALRTGSRGCCSLEDSSDARRVADRLGIPFYVWDLSDRFRADVVDPFIASYAVGETPNPCLRCNEKIKFAAVLERGLALGFDAVATGHYARLEDGVLRRSTDDGKDQSYVLGVLTQHQIDHSLFPCGDTPKPQIRAEAEALGLAVASKPDSHDICFIPTGKTQTFLGLHLGTRTGDLVDSVTGDVLGTHRGIHEFTVGQRKGLGLTRPAADGRPRYVIDVDAATNTVTVGPQEHLDVTGMAVDRTVWLRPAERWLSSGDPLRCRVQVRAHGGLRDATVTAPEDDGTVRVELAAPLRGVARGQAAVFYLPDAGGDIVVGSGTICATHRAPVPA